VAVLGPVAAAHLPALLRPVVSEVVTVTEGVRSVSRHGDGVRLVLDPGEHLDVAGVFVATTLRQSAPFAAQLGLELNPSGCVLVDDRGRTSRAGVYAAGDMAHVAALPMPMASVVQSLAAGAMVGGTVVADLLTGG
jgi:thioredoxin reductase